MRLMPVARLKPGMIIGLDIVCNKGTAFMLKKGVKLTEEHISYLSSQGYLGAYITDPWDADFEFEEPVSQETIRKGMAAIENLDIQALMETAEKIVSDISLSDKISMDIVDLRSFDDYTYHHSVNVAIYAVAVGKYMNLPYEKLLQLCQAGLCHDLGKQRIPLDIINKPGKLSDEEFEAIRSHPQYSIDILRENPEISAVVRQAVFCHHENENGSGYPQGLEGSQIPLLAKIIHAVDVFDALISRRPYKDPYSPVEAFEYMMGGTNILFDGEVVSAMKKVIPAYPIATEIRLSDRRRAIVVDHTNDAMRPIVRLMDTLDYLDLTDSANKDLYIESGSEAEEEYTHTVEKLNESRLEKKDKPAEIMLVDDSVLNLQGTCDMLYSEGYHLTALQSGLAAIHFIQDKGAPDLIIMDIQMPGMDGVETVTTIRNLGYPDLPVIFLTAKADKETVLRCVHAKAKDYIVKPARPAYLRARVAIALNASLER